DDARGVVIQDLPADLHAVAHRAQDVDDRAPHRRLAAARLADQAERLSAMQLERHALDGVHFADATEQHAAADGEPHVELLDVEEDFAHDDCPRSPGGGTAGVPPCG